MNKNKLCNVTFYLLYCTEPYFSVVLIVSGVHVPLLTSFWVNNCFTVPHKCIAGPKELFHFSDKQAKTWSRRLLICLEPVNTKCHSKFEQPIFCGL